MADFFTDSDDDKAVEELLSQAMDSTVLEQVAAINCSGFSDSGLPSHLETRFHKLKSFPSSAKNPPSLSTKTFSHSEFRENKAVNDAKNPDSSEEKIGENSENVHPKCSTKSPEGKSCLSSEHSKCSTKSLEGKSCLSSETGSLSPFKKLPRGRTEKKGAKTSSFSSSEGFSSRSVSPPAKSGCFLCSPKKVSRKKSKENRGFDLGLDWGKHDELLSDISNFSANHQKKMIKKAMDEEERVCREAEKIVKWAKQASARMDFPGIEDELSDDDNPKFH